MYFKVKVLNGEVYYCILCNWIIVTDVISIDLV